MSRSFSAWKEGAPYYTPPLLTGGLLAGLLWPHASALWSGPFFLVGLAMLFFFRDPARAIAAEQNTVASPADGTVVSIDDVHTTSYYDGPCRRISIFLSLLDPHVNRSPSDGRVVRVEYKPGRFKNAMKTISAEVNESNAIWLETPHGPITVRQISGALARRIVCRAREGDRVSRGERVGMIRFGSRTELYMPRHVELSVALKQKVRAGATVVARFP